MQYSYSYAVHVMQCQGAWLDYGGAYIHTTYTALIWQTSNDKEKQTLSFIVFDYLDQMIIYLTSKKHFYAWRDKKNIRAYVNMPATDKLAIAE